MLVCFISVILLFWKIKLIIMIIKYSYSIL